MDNSQISIIYSNFKYKEIINKTESLPFLYDKINFNNIVNMSYIFYNCDLLSHLPDISK